MNTSPSLYANLSDTELLTKLIGVRQTQKCYRGSLGALFPRDCLGPNFRPCRFSVGRRGQGWQKTENLNFWKPD